MTDTPHPVADDPITPTTTPGERAVFKISIRGTMRAVWHEITKTDSPQLAMFGAQMVTPGLEPGASIKMCTPDGKYVSVVGEVLEFTPMTRFSHTMRFTAYDDPHSVVTYELEDKGDEVLFTLTVDGLLAGTKSAKSMRQGGPFICKTLKSVVEKGKPSLFVRSIYTVFKVLGPVMTPKKCRAENWE